MRLYLRDKYEGITFNIYRILHIEYGYTYIKTYTTCNN